MDGMAMGVPLDDIAHVIQVALTPVFLLSGIGSLLNVINARVSRVADQADALVAALRAGEGDLLRQHGSLAGLRRRLRALDVARASGAVAGAAICGATFALFLGALQNAGVATALFLLFGASVLFTMAAMVAFFVEVVLSCRRDLRVPGVGAPGATSIG